MKTVIYSQHVLGVGHYFRSLEICRALKGNEVILVSGGPPVQTPLPGHVRQLALPQLQMDPEFKQLRNSATGVPVEEIKRRRTSLLWELLATERADALVVELFPFGRKAFRFELDPVLNAIRDGKLPACGVFSSVRDILVEKENAEKHERRVVKSLNDCFDAVLVHGDSRLIGLERTFGLYAEIRIPVVYTGYISPAPPPGARARVRAELGIGDDRKLIVASAGGGSVGFRLLKTVLEAFELLPAAANLVLFTGPFMAPGQRRQLERLAGTNAVVEAFTDDFISWLAAADLSVSMAGYNTTMNILSSGVAALVFPFDQNREQRTRAQRLADLGALGLLEAEELHPQRLAERMTAALNRPFCRPGFINLDGAARTAGWLEQWHRDRTASI